MAKTKSCVPDMVEATMGILTEAEAKRMIGEISRQAQERAAAQGIPIEQAVRDVAWERRNTINLADALGKKAAALQLKAKVQIVRFVTSTKGKSGRVDWIKNLN